MATDINASGGANNKKIYFYLVAAILIAAAFLTGGLLARKMDKKAEALWYNKGWEEAKIRYGKICALPSSSDQQFKVKSFSGRVKGVNAGSLVVDANPIGLNSQKNTVMAVKIDSATQIRRVLKKEDAEFDAEMEEYNKKNVLAGQELEPSVPPPSNFKQVNVNLETLENGDMIMVTATEEIDSNDTEVIAAEILIDYQPTKE